MGGQASNVAFVAAFSNFSPRLQSICLSPSRLTCEGCLATLYCVVPLASFSITSLVWSKIAVVHCRVRQHGAMRLCTQSAGLLMEVACQGSVANATFDACLHFPLMRFAERDMHRWCGRNLHSCSHSIIQFSPGVFFSDLPLLDIIRLRKACALRCFDCNRKDDVSRTSRASSFRPSRIKNST